MKPPQGAVGRWAFRLCLIPFGFCLAAALIEVSLWLTLHNPRKVYFNPYLSDPVYRQVVGRIEKDWAADFRKNRLSLRGPEPVSPKVIALGDSCTAGCYVPEAETYAGRLSSRSIEVLNAGVPGYSTYQALAWVRRTNVLRYHPKLVTIYYGWNDHWRAAATERVFYWMRLASPYSFIAAWALKYEQGIWDPRWAHRFVPRVPLWEYKSNLRELIGDARKSGAVAVLITAPVEMGLAPPEEVLKREGRIAEMADHAVYAAATREVAAEMGAGLVDFAAEYERRKTKDPRKYFGDFVHPNSAGHRMLADLLRPWVACAMAGSCPPSER